VIPAIDGGLKVAEVDPIALELFKNAIFSIDVAELQPL